MFGCGRKSSSSLHQIPAVCMSAACGLGEGHCLAVKVKSHRHVLRFTQEISVVLAVGVLLVVEDWWVLFCFSGLSPAL